MNKDRRARIANLRETLENIRDNELEGILDEEREAFDGMPESLQNSERGEMSQNAISNLENALAELESVISYLESAEE